MREARASDEGEASSHQRRAVHGLRRASGSSGPAAVGMTGANGLAGHRLGREAPSLAARERVLMHGVGSFLSGCVTTFIA